MLVYIFAVRGLTYSISSFNLNGMFICLYCCIREGERGLDIPSTRSHVKILQIGNTSLKNEYVK